MQKQLLLFDIGGSSVKRGIWNGETLIQLDKMKTPGTWEEMKTLFLETLEGLPDQSFDGVAISSPGAVDAEKGIINGISAVPYIHGFPIKKELETLFDLPVAIQNDANCAALAELWKGNAQGAKDVGFVIIGSGIGGALILDGKLYTGHNLFGGEFGYQVVDLNSLATLSDLGSPIKMAKRYAEKKGDGLGYTSEHVFELAESGDSDAVEAVDQFYTALSVGIFNLLVSINPEKVLIGGGISRREGIVPALRAKVAQLTESKGAGDLQYELEVCKHFNDSNLIGAAYQFKIENDQL